MRHSKYYCFKLKRKSGDKNTLWWGKRRERFVSHVQLTFSRPANTLSIKQETESCFCFYFLYSIIERENKCVTIKALLASLHLSTLFTMSVTILTDWFLNQFQYLNIQWTICHTQRLVAFLKCDLVHVHTTRLCHPLCRQRDSFKSKTEGGDGGRWAERCREPEASLCSPSHWCIPKHLMMEERFTLKDISCQEVPSYFLNDVHVWCSVLML